MKLKESTENNNKTSKQKLQEMGFTINKYFGGLWLRGLYCLSVKNLDKRIEYHTILSPISMLATVRKLLDENGYRYRTIKEFKERPKNEEEFFDLILTDAQKREQRNKQ